MTKTQAKQLFGGNNKLALALKKTPGAVSQWNEELTEDQKNLVVGCAIRHSILIPDEILRGSA